MTDLYIFLIGFGYGMVAYYGYTKTDFYKKHSNNNHITDGSKCWCNPKIIKVKPSSLTSKHVKK